MPRGIYVRTPEARAANGMGHRGCRYVLRKPRRLTPLADRFWAKVGPPVDRGYATLCREWMASGLPSGYGTIGLGRRKVGSHRVAWELAFGPIPPDRLVCHRCDNPPCCEITHLFLGTDADNMADMYAKGRDNAGGRKYTQG